MAEHGNPFLNRIRAAGRTGAERVSDPVGFNRRTAAAEAEDARLSSTNLLLDTLAAMPDLPPNIRQMIDARLKDPEGFAAGLTPGAIAGVSGVESLLRTPAAAAAPPTREQIIRISGTDPRNEQFGLGIDPNDTVRVKITTDLQGNTVSFGLASASDPAGASEDTLESIRIINSDNPLNAEYELGIPEGGRARVKVTTAAATGQILIAGLASTTDPAAGTAPTGPFGNGLRGRSLNQLIGLKPAFDSGELTDEQLNIIDTALKVAVQPVPFENSVTHEIEQFVLELPSFAQKMKDALFPGPPVAEEPPARVARIQSALSALPSGPTMFEQADNLTGPDSFLARTVPRFPGLGTLAGETTDAEVVAKDVTELLVDALRIERTATTRAVSEMTDLRERFGIAPEIINTPEVFRTTMAQRDIMLADREDAIIRRISAPKGDVTQAQRKRDLEALARIQQVRPMLSPPALQTAEEIAAFIKINPAGTVFVMRDPDAAGNPWIDVEVK